MFITYNDIPIAPASDLSNRRVGWAATIPPNCFDEKNKAYLVFNLTLDATVTWLQIYFKYKPDYVMDEGVYTRPVKR